MQRVGPGVAAPVLIFAAVALFATPFGCQEPFAEDRHDLASFRVAGVSAATDEDGDTTLSAAVWSGLGPYHDTLPQLAWSTSGDLATGQGATMAVDFPGAVELTASSGDAVEAARLDLDHAVAPPVVAGFTRLAVDLDIAQVADPVDERLAVEPTEDAPIAVGSAARLHLDVPDDTTVRWMATGGQFSELDSHTTDWFAGTAVLDDNEVDSTDLIDPGIYTLLALVVDQAGANAWYWLDVAVDVDSPLLYTRGRLFPVDAEPSDGPWFADVVESDDPAGLALSNLRAPGDSEVAVCASAAGAGFDFGPVADGWCTRADVVGRSVRVEGTVR